MLTIPREYEIKDAILRGTTFDGQRAVMIDEAARRIYDFLLERQNGPIAGVCNPHRHHRARAQVTWWWQRIYNQFVY